ncbi:MAG: flagellar biosynthetic protein FliO [Parachlamydiales bacterium]|jgi:flagellar protein FliO/FliZ
MKKIFLIFFFLFSFTLFDIKIYGNENAAKNENSIFQDNNENLLQSTNQMDYKPAFLRMIFILIALLAMIFLVFWLFRKLSGLRTSQANLTKNIKIIETRVISPKSMLYLIEINGKKVLISESNLEVRKITDVD